MRLTEQQIAFRAKHLNASEFAAMLGMSPYKDDNRISLWCRKTGLVPNDHFSEEDQDQFWWGHELEPIIAQRFSAKSGHKLVPGGSFEHHEHDWCACTVDRRIIGADANLEIKVVGQYMAKDWKLSDPIGIPHYVMTQVQIQMACTGRKKTYVAALVGGPHEAYWEIDAQLDLQAHLLHEGKLFWQNVVDGIRPEVDGSEASRQMMQALYPKDIRPIMQATDDLFEVAASRNQADNELDRAKTRRDKSDQLLMEACGDHAAIVHPEFRFSWACDKSGVRRKRFTWKGVES